MNKIKIFSVTLLAVAFFGKASAQEGKMNAAKLKEATVFFAGAELVHETSIALQKGNSEVKISGLSPTVDKNSIKIKTSAGVLVSSFEFSTDYLTEKTPNNEEIKKLKESIETAEKQLAKINTSLKINKEMLSILQKSIIKNVEGSESGLAINDLKQTLDYYKTKSLETEELIRLDTEEKQKTERDIGRMQRQLDQESMKNDKLSGVLTLSLVATNAAACDFIISYYTPSARWIPYYDINTQSIQKPIKITHKAKVSQTTGMDWNNVKLSLSTSSPSFGKAAPLFNAWFLDFVDTKTNIAVRANRESTNYYIDGVPATMSGVRITTQNTYSYDKKSEGYVGGGTGSGAGKYKEETLFMDDYVQQSENHLNLFYEINLPYSIPGNGKEVNIELKNQEVPADFKYYSAPKLDIETYLLAEIADWQKLNLLSGKANITYDGTYVGETFINASSTLENLALTLGSDKRVAVKREKLTEFSSTKSIGSETRQTLTYQLTVRNNQNVPINMTLKEQYPISTQREIEVELFKETTMPTFNNTETGVVTWEFELQPGEQKIFKLSYSVKYPKGRTVNL
ncbi:MAG: mucoidy inhibitor MuiA family protein [Lentimicrobiaceae bacterium]|nr:mucoidy inhibitor MuiA family protein [Lentimicrobiaceae bacterium]